eukprot:754142-Hanusia_phi.AAC.4
MAVDNCRQDSVIEVSFSHEGTCWYGRSHQDLVRLHSSFTSALSLKPLKDRGHWGARDNAGKAERGSSCRHKSLISSAGRIRDDQLDAVASPGVSAACRLETPATLWCEVESDERLQDRTMAIVSCGRLQAS